MIRPEAPRHEGPQVIDRRTIVRTLAAAVAAGPLSLLSADDNRETDDPNREVTGFEVASKIGKLGRDIRELHKLISTYPSLKSKAERQGIVLGKPSGGPNEFTIFNRDENPERTETEQSVIAVKYSNASPDVPVGVSFNFQVYGESMDAYKRNPAPIPTRTDAKWLAIGENGVGSLKEEKVFGFEPDEFTTKSQDQHSPIRKGQLDTFATEIVKRIVQIKKKVGLFQTWL